MNREWTTGEADAWRAGRAASPITRAAPSLKRVLDAMAAGEPWRIDVADIDAAREALEALMAEDASGLAERGG